MPKEFEVHFTCPKCGEQTCLQEVLTDVKQFTNISTINDDGLTNFVSTHNISLRGKHYSSYEGGKIQSWECGSCGYQLKRDETTFSSWVITHEEELFKWLRDHDCLVFVNQDERCPAMQKKEIKGQFSPAKK